MKWLTLTEIGRRARSKKGALEVSYELWNQRYKATAKEYQQAIKDKIVPFGCDYCGLCRYYHPSCGKCPLGKLDMFCRGPKSIYTKAWRASDKWRLKPTVTNWWAWKRAAKALRDKLKELMDRR